MANRDCGEAGNLKLESYGPWAVVTGASSGLGTAFARRIASAGLNVVVVGRHRERLRTVAEELSTRQAIQVRTVALDLATPASAETLVGKTADLDVGLLVSNAGSGLPGSFLGHELRQELDVVQLNVATPVSLVHCYADRMLSAGRGGIILVGSTLGYQGTPFAATYAASKAFTLVFAESLHFELRPRGVDLLVVSPGAVDTPARERHPIDFSKLPLRFMPPDEVVETAVRALGRRAAVIPGGINNLQALLSGPLTREALALILGRLAEDALPEELR